MDELTRLAVAARDGDREALAAFVRRTQADVWRFCAHAGDRDAVDDLTQETYLRAIGSLRTFRAEASARTWLLSVAWRVCADAVRRNRRQRAVLDRVRATTIEGTMADPTGGVDLDDLVASLDPDRRSAFVLTQVLGLSYDEAAGVCSCPIGTIRSRVARARLDLVRAAGADMRSRPGAAER
jgi:RNA polymerase sigma-70 factor, ECF subfamily